MRRRTVVAALAAGALSGCAVPGALGPASATTATTATPAATGPARPVRRAAAAPPQLPPEPNGPRVSARAAGAVGDGTTDDLAALQAALDSAVPGSALVLDDGAAFAVGGVLVVRTAGVALLGAGTLLATREDASCLLVAADDVLVSGPALAVTGTTRRWEGADQHRLRLEGVRGVVVRGVSVTGSAAAGVYVAASTDFLLEDVAVSDTRADGVHVTAGSARGVVRRPLVTRSGDDAVAVVSYARDGAPCRDVAVELPVVRTTTGGRGVAVVGGERVVVTGLDVEDSAAAGLLVAAEGSYDTAGVSGVRVSGGVLRGANRDGAVDHGGVLVVESAGRVVRDVVVEDLEVVGTRPGASRQVGVLAGDAGGAVTGVTITGLRLRGGPARLLETTGDVSALVATGWSLDGAPVPDPAPPG